MRSHCPRRLGSHRCHAIPSTYDALLRRPALLHAPPRSLARRAVLSVVHPLCCTAGVALLLQRHPLPLKSLMAYAGSAVGRRRADTEAAWLRGQRNDGRQDERDRKAGVAGGRGAVRAIVRCDNSTLVADMRTVGLWRSARIDQWHCDERLWLVRCHARRTIHAVVNIQRADVAYCNHSCGLHGATCSTKHDNLAVLHAAGCGTQKAEDDTLRRLRAHGRSVLQCGSATVRRRGGRSGAT